MSGDSENVNAADEKLPGEKEHLTEVEVRPVIECLLFATNEPISVKRFTNILPGVPASVVRRLLLELQVEYDHQGHGMQIIEVAGGYQMATRREYAPFVLKLNRHRKRSSLSTSTLETLAIVAYKQPIIRAEIEAIRGVDSSGVIRSLVELGLVKVVGKKEVVGHPPLYGTTAEFLKVFGLKRLSDLPSIKELREQFENKEYKVLTDDA